MHFVPKNSYLIPTTASVMYYGDYYLNTLGKIKKAFLFVAYFNVKLYVYSDIISPE